MITIVKDDGTPHNYSNNGDSSINPLFIYAKAINYLEFYVLASSNGDLFNIVDSTCVRNKKDFEKGGLKFNLTKCSRECYELYSRFLRTRNYVDFNLARRSFLNG